MGFYICINLRPLNNTSKHLNIKHTDPSDYISGEVLTKVQLSHRWPADTLTSRWNIPPRGHGSGFSSDTLREKTLMSLLFSYLESDYQRAFIQSFDIMPFCPRLIAIYKGGSPLEFPLSQRISLVARLLLPHVAKLQWSQKFGPPMTRPAFQAFVSLRYISQLSKSSSSTVLVSKVRYAECKRSQRCQARITVQLASWSRFPSGTIPV